MTKTYNARGNIIKHYNPLERLKMAIKRAIKQRQLNNKDFMQI